MNGWTNWETWETFNWLNTCEEVYQEARRARGGKELQRVVREAILGQDIDRRKINYKELKEALSDE